MAKSRKCHVHPLLCPWLNMRHYVTWFDAIGVGPEVMTLSLYSHLNPQALSRVLVSIERWATWLILARASPRNPYVEILLRSRNSLNLLVVNLSATMPKSSCLIPVPLSLVEILLRDFSEWEGYMKSINHTGIKIRCAHM